MPLSKDKSKKIIETLKGRLGAGSMDVEVPASLKAEPVDIVFHSLQEPRRESPVLPAPPPREAFMERLGPMDAGIAGLGQSAPPLTPPQPRQPAAPQGPQQPEMDLSGIFDF